MVNFDAVTIGLEVEFKSEEGHVERGVVRYKGPINGKPGNWVGIEARRAVGFCDGRIMGRTYFKCPENFGLFLSADELRLATNSRKKKKSLYKSAGSECDELLFKKSMPQDNLIVISEDYLRRAKSAFEIDQSYSDVFSAAPRYNLRDSLVVIQKPKKKEKLKNDKETESNFQPVPSVRRSFMPSDEMQVYAKMNWSYKNVSLPREKSLNGTFDGFNKQRANYIGPAL